MVKKLKIRIFSIGRVWGEFDQIDFSIPTFIFPVPYYVPEDPKGLFLTKNGESKSGIFPDVQDWVMAHGGRNAISNILKYLQVGVIPFLSNTEILQIVFYCDGGISRSVAVAEIMGVEFESRKYNVSVTHLSLYHAPEEAQTPLGPYKPRT